ncbi:hypothetical protein COLO4_35573 [Corchorus olitorius]|uniref:Uncharacterized protein n=1 Tax=Corchorus olitorius TaxID=93759 RepID=A0A1R3GF73_9ROSI|nr:hypothetical protein COLO4_35573 [Corchorus olitorius]
MITGAADEHVNECVVCQRGSNSPDRDWDLCQGLYGIDGGGGYTGQVMRDRKDLWCNGFGALC